MSEQLHSVAEIQTTLHEPAVLLYFFHDQCPPCRVLRPKVETLLQSTFPEMKLVLVDGLQHPKIAAQWNIFGFPTLLGLFEGKEYFRKSKFVSLAELSQAIQRPYDLLFALG